MSVKLARLVGRLECRREEEAEAARAAGTAYGLVYTSEQRSLPRPLAGGEHLAMDVRWDGYCGGVPRLRTIERAALRPDDLGLVYLGDSAEVVGQVVQLEPPYFTMCLRPDIEAERERRWSGPRAEDGWQPPPDDAAE